MFGGIADIGRKMGLLAVPPPKKLKTFRCMSSNFLHFLGGIQVLWKYNIWMLCSQLQLEPRGAPEYEF